MLRQRSTQPPSDAMAATPASRLMRAKTTTIRIPCVDAAAARDTADDVEAKDQTSESVGFFGSERTPAALMAGSAITILFAFPLRHGDDEASAFLKRTYLALAASSFCHSLITVFVSSLAITRLLSKQHDAMARDPLVMMLREYPLFFLSVRVHFLTGVLCFVGAITLRVYVEVGRESPLLARALLCMTGSSLSYMLCLYNMTLVNFRHFGHLWWCYARIVFERFVVRAPEHGKPAGVLGAVALVLACASLVDFVRVVAHYVAPTAVPKM
ncbi:hypothetical protein KFE25_009220 [Diacronema lutheri]|uniref:Uncharacterized protein n=2 Tax=Diacronema lutheri TaxID=2081491 RepID=A0A8J6CFK4_DIALT|nr:hypothetical protein KFE25_009220 [Diacronema lutheri]